MRPLPATLAFLALLAAATAVGLFLLGGEPPGPEELPTELPRTRPVHVPVPPRMDLPRGGIYAGIVVDEDGTPVVAAIIRLVAFDTGEEAFRRQPEDPQSFDASQIAVIDFRTAAEGKTDAAGRFRIAADARSAIRLVLAFHKGYAPGLVAVEGPTESLRIVLSRAGEFVGHVVDDETGRPIAGARVAIYLQNRTRPVTAGEGEKIRRERNRDPVSVFAVAQRWVARELGPLVWGVEWQGDEAIHMLTDEDGEFRLAPIGDEVQLEFVITHPGYMWTEFDRREDGGIERTVVPRGGVVERTFRLQKGKWIEGNVVDRDTGRGVPEVLVIVEHVAQHTQHWWYRTKGRRTRTQRDGSFRVGGLSFGPYIARYEHPAFGRENVHGIPENARDLRWYAPHLGAIHGRVEGLGEGNFGAEILVLLESIDDVPDQSRHRQFRPRLLPEDDFLLRGIRPGRWRTWAKAAGRSSMPQEVEIEGLEVEEVTYVLGGGGAFELRVWDAGGRIVDPAMVVLIRVGGEDGATEQPLGRFVTREGRLDASGVVPGRYVARVTAPGFLPARTEPFRVVEEGRTSVADVVLHEAATLRVAGIYGADGRPATCIVRLSVREGDGAFRMLPPIGRPEVPVRPGEVTVRALATDGSSWEETFEVSDGELLPVTVRLAH